MRAIDRLGRVAAALIVAALFSLPAVYAGEVEAQRGSGLEVTQYRSLRVLVEELRPDANRVGLTESVIRNRVELRLRSAGIKPIPAMSLDPPESVYVSISVVDRAFDVLVTFNRPMTYSVGNRTFWVLAHTWLAGATGNSSDATYVLGILDQQLDKFLNEYLRANQ